MRPPAIVTFKDWSQRNTSDLSQAAILGNLAQTFRDDIPEAVVIAFPPPAIRGLGVSGGFQMEVQDIGGQGSTLEQSTRNLVATGNSQSQLPGWSPTFSARRAAVVSGHRPHEGQIARFAAGPGIQHAAIDAWAQLMSTTSICSTARIK